ncbi:MAG TPA: glyoxalase [Acidimicrobiia bacterium]|nr:glyoxalase [Acidimicrobiia bacterium]
MRLEVVILPVSDVDQAKTFYEQAGFVIDVDHQASEHFRVVQLTPLGSACSITFGVGLGETPASPLKGIHLCVANIEEAVAELTDRGIECDRSGTWDRADGLTGPTRNAESMGATPGSPTPTATGGCFRRSAPLERTKPVTPERKASLSR